VTTAEAQARADELLGELEATVEAMEPAAQLEVRAGVVRVSEAILTRAVGAAAVARAVTEQEYGLAAAAAVLGRSERWLRAHRGALRIGYRLAGSGPWRFTAAELERVREKARRKARP
jgi:hypothetical protein